MLNTRLVLVLIASLALIVLFLLLPKQPASVRSQQQAPLNVDSLKLEEAVKLVRSPNPMEGIRLLRELVEKDSTNLDAQFQLGLFSIESGQMEKAIARFEKILAMDSTHAGALVEWGGIKFQAGQKEEALELFRKSLITHPDDMVANFLAAQIEDETGQLEEAKKHYAKVLELTRDTTATNEVKRRIENINKKLIP
ncbi:MAG: tetratricopeptide repeat protein [Flavobacteriales bacterium]|nr:tetratricopeptide repeat protein [Flavobacteriales bacterium]